MKSQIIKPIAILALLTVLISCTDDRRSDCDCPEGTIQSINPGEKSSSFAIDNNIISFAVPYLVCTSAHEYPPQSNPETPNIFSPHVWMISLLFAKGTDITKLAPVITLTPGATITSIESIIGDVQNFSRPVWYIVIATDGSTVTYKFVARAIDDI